MSRVLITGGSGFLGSHTILAALRYGHSVRTTVRSQARAEQVRDMVAAGGADPDDVEIVVADLRAEAGWDEAVDRCDAVLHVASPFPSAQPTDPDDLIVPARDGTIRVLSAARAAGVRRVVMTSSFATIGYGPSPGRPWNENDWTEPTLDLAPYVRSKVESERAAWDIAADGLGPELVVLNPTGIFGPVLGAAVGTSASLILSMLTGQMVQAPRHAFGVVDVRDLADAHLQALEIAEAAGQRILLTSPPATSFLGVATTLRRELGARAANCPTTEAEGEPVVVPEFDVRRARRLFAWRPRSPTETIIDTAMSLLARIDPLASSAIDRSETPSRSC